MNNTKSKIIIWIYRLGNSIYKKKNRFYKILIKPIYFILNKLITEFIFGVELSEKTDIGKDLVLEHGGNGIVIHPKAKIGNNVVIYHQVTIGGYGLAHFDNDYINNNNNKGGVPEIGNNVFIGAGAKILGNVKVGNGAKIGANAVVLKDVPEGATAVGIPAKIILN